MAWKNPAGVMVVMVAGSSCLLIERADWVGFWQSVTGSIEPGESLLEAAARELFEETGFGPAHGQLIDAGYRETYDIFPRFRYRYDPEISQGTLDVFWFVMNAQHAPILAPAEHLDYTWLHLNDAQLKVIAGPNRTAIERWLMLEEKEK
ncbi:MAG: dihydroneopterin triphosphate diphosphatase [Pseudomonadota bacterium]